MSAPASSKLLVFLAPENVARFRFLLEAYENLALFTVLERRTALLKLIFVEESRGEVLKALDEIGRTVTLRWQKWPL